MKENRNAHPTPPCVPAERLIFAAQRNPRTFAHDNGTKGCNGRFSTRECWALSGQSRIFDYFLHGGPSDPYEACLACRPHSAMLISRRGRTCPPEDYLPCAGLLWSPALSSRQISHIRGSPKAAVWRVIVITRMRAAYLCSVARRKNYTSSEGPT
jgi:hypothetical protein